MKSNEKVLAEAVRIEFEQKNGNVYIVFKVIDEKFKNDIKNNWTKDIEYRLIDRSLYTKDD